MGSEAVLGLESGYSVSCNWRHIALGFIILLHKTGRLPKMGFLGAT